MARKGILYEQVTDAITALQNNRQKITVRAIHALTGGSMSTVLKHYRRWQSEQLGHNPESTEISPYLSEALHNELRNYARRALMAMETRLSAKDEKLKEIEAAHEKALCEIKKLQLSLKESEKSPATGVSELKKQLQTALRGRTKAQEQLHKVREQAKTLENRLAETEKRAIHAEKQLEKQKNEDKSHPQRNNPPSSKPATNTQQEAFEF